MLGQSLYIILSPGWCAECTYVHRAETERMPCFGDLLRSLPLRDAVARGWRRATCDRRTFYIGRMLGWTKHVLTGGRSTAFACALHRGRQDLACCFLAASPSSLPPPFFVLLLS